MRTKITDKSWLNKTARDNRARAKRCRENAEKDSAFSDDWLEIAKVADELASDCDKRVADLETR